MRYRTHPLTIVANLGRVLYLTIIPVLRGFFFALQGDLGQWVQSAWIDILIVVAMVLLAVWRWWVVTYSYTEQAVTLNAGWLVRRSLQVPWDRITTLSSLRSFYLRPFRAVKLRADTIGGSTSSADFTIYIWKDQAETILERARLRGGQRLPREYIPRTGSIVAMSLLTSNSFAGILFISTFISQSGRILGDNFSNLIVGTFEEVVRALAFGLPPATAATAYILLGGWFIGFLLAFCRYKNFSVSRSRNSLNIQGGLFSNRAYSISYSHINFIDIRQSLSTKVLNLHSLYLSAVGYAKQKDDISCVIPTESREVFTLHRERLFPAFSPAKRQIGPPKSGIMRFIGPALLWLVALPLAIVLLIWLFPGWRGFILFVGIMLMVPALFFLAIRWIEFSTGGVAKSGRYYTLRYSKGFSLHTVIIPAEKIVSIELRQSPIQRIGGNCDLVIATRSEHKVHHRCRNLCKANLQKMLNI